jgi:hypothetical protein
VVYIPPYSDLQTRRWPYLPPFLERFPTAVINYRWAGSAPHLTSSTETRHSDGPEHFSTPLYWPTPVHDTAFGYDWILKNLSPPDTSRRDVYIHGSYLGASLAASLALVSTFPHERMAVRGLVAYNGIYDWTIFLPDHRVNQPSTKSKSSRPVSPPDEGSQLHLLNQQIPQLFSKPSDLFDSFASACLFFQTAGLIVPKTFGISEEMTSMIDALASATKIGESIPSISDTMLLKNPRRSRLIFPSRQSTLELPKALLLYDMMPMPILKMTAKNPTRARRARKTLGNSFETQAIELASLMRRSYAKERTILMQQILDDNDFTTPESEAENHIRLHGIGSEHDSIDKNGQQLSDIIMGDWLGAVSRY